MNTEMTWNQPGSQPAGEHAEVMIDMTPPLSEITFAAPESTSTGTEAGSQEWIKKMKTHLRQLQPPMSTLDRVLFELAEEIRQRRDAGCSTNDIARLLTEHGAAITGPALARHLRNGSKATGKTRKSMPLRGGSTT